MSFFLFYIIILIKILDTEVEVDQKTSMTDTEKMTEKDATRKEVCTKKFIQLVLIGFYVILNTK